VSLADPPGSAEMSRGAGIPLEELRVTPEELALAAASLERKREGETRKLGETVPLAEAIEQLGLNLTAEELGPEVEAIRAERALAGKGEQERRILNRAVLAATFALLLAVIGILGILPERSRGVKAEIVRTAPLPVAKIPEVPDGLPVHLDTATLSALAGLTMTPADASVDTRPAASAGKGTFNNEWILVKSGQDLSVQAWATADQALQARNRQKTMIFSERPPWIPSANLVPVTVPLYRFGIATISGADRGGAFTEPAKAVLQVAGLETSDDAVGSILTGYLERAEGVVDDPNDRQFWVSARVDGSVVSLSGNVKSASRKGRATALAREALKRLGVPDSVSNQITVDPTGP